MIKRQPEANHHGEAWFYFLQAPTIAAALTRQDWLMFLAGWKAKAKQQQDLKRKR